MNWYFSNVCFNEWICIFQFCRKVKTTNTLLWIGNSSWILFTLTELPSITLFLYYIKMAVPLNKLNYVKVTNPPAYYHVVIFHFICRCTLQRVIQPESASQKYRAFWCQNYPSQFYFGNSSSPSISWPSFSIRIRLPFVLFKTMLDKNKVT